jgi:hypothetical protein
MLSVAPQRVAGLLFGVERLHLVAPYETDSRRWLEMPWLDICTGERFSIGRRTRCLCSVSRRPGAPYLPLVVNISRSG